MQAKLIFSFAAGLIVATSIIGAAYFFDSEDEPSKQRIATPTEEEMKAKLASAGYLIHTEEEWNEVIASAEEKEEEKAEAPEDVKEKIVYRTFLTVSEGMTSIDVGKILVKGKVLDNALEFSNEVEKRGVSTYLRPGTYEIDSDMTMDKIISTIFKQST